MFYNINTRKVEDWLRLVRLSHYMIVCDVVQF